MNAQLASKSHSLPPLHVHQCNKATTGILIKLTLDICWHLFLELHLKTPEARAKLITQVLS
jgi:hypothetical protein